MNDKKLTGRIRHRTNSYGELVLQVEYKLIGVLYETDGFWRDAKVTDLTVEKSLSKLKIR